MPVVVQPAGTRRRSSAKAGRDCPGWPPPGNPRRSSLDKSPALGQVAGSLCAIAEWIPDDNQLISTALRPMKGQAASSPGLIQTLRLTGPFSRWHSHRDSQTIGRANPHCSFDCPRIAGDQRQGLECFSECGLGGRRKGTVCRFCALGHAFSRPAPPCDL